MRKAPKIGVIGGLLIATSCGSSSSTTDQTVPTTATNPSQMAAARASLAQNEEQYLGDLQAGITLLTQSPRLKTVPSDRDGLTAQVFLIGTYAKTYKFHPDHLSAKGEALRQRYGRLLSAYQRDAFPKLRKAQAEVLDQLMWKNDIRVKAIGSGYSNLKLTGIAFSLNSMVDEAHQSAADALIIFRFRRNSFEAYPGSRGPYYTLEPFSDGTIATFENDRWEKV